MCPVAVLPHRDPPGFLGTADLTLVGRRSAGGLLPALFDAGRAVSDRPAEATGFSVLLPPSAYRVL